MYTSVFWKAAASLALGAALTVLPRSQEYEVKAAFVLNFPKYTTYPEGALGSSGAPFIVGVLGDDPFDGALEKAFKGRVIHGHPTLVKEISNARQGRSCQAVFICSSETSHLREVLGALEGAPVLTIGDTDGYVSRGVMIEMFRQNANIRFSANVGASKAAGLKFSSAILKLAKSVVGS